MIGRRGSQSFLFKSDNFNSRLPYKAIVLKTNPEIIVTASNDATLMKHNIQTGTHLLTFKGH